MHMYSCAQLGCLMRLVCFSHDISFFAICVFFRCDMQMLSFECCNGGLRVTFFSNGCSNHFRFLYGQFYIPRGTEILCSTERCSPLRNRSLSFSSTLLSRAYISSLFSLVPYEFFPPLLVMTLTNIFVRSYISGTRLYKYGACVLDVWLGARSSVYVYLGFRCL